MALLRLAFIAVVLCHLVADLATARTWWTKDGKFSVEAELLNVEDGNAVLKRADGQVVKVPLDRLSLADNLYVKQATGALPPDTPPGRAPQSPDVPTGEPSPTGKPATWSEPPLTKPGRGEWQVRKDPPGLPLVIPADLKISIRLAGRSTRAAPVFPAAHVPFVAIRDESSESFALYDLRTAERAGRIEKIQHCMEMAVSPDGKRLAAISLDAHGKIQLWSFASGKVERSFDLDRTFSTVQAMEFAGPDRLLASLPIDDKIMVWNVHTAAVVTSIAIGSSAAARRLAVSPGGSYVAVASTQGSIEIFDTRNGERAGALTRETSGIVSVQGLAFAPDGSELAMLVGSGSSTTLSCWGMSDGKLIVEHKLKDAPTSFGLNHKILVWFADKSAWLVNGKAVVDRKLGGPVWVEEQRLRVEGARRYVDAQRMLAVEGDDQVASLNLVPIPKDRLQAGATVVASGGVAVDAGLPRVTPVNSAPATPRDTDAQHLELSAGRR